MSLLKIILFFLIIITIQACRLQKGYLLFKEKENDFSTTKDLNDFFRDNPNASIVLRAPNTDSQITQSSFNNSIYNTIEKQLLKAGFNIKDRNLFEEVVLKNSSTSYSDIYNLTKTDLIIELTTLNTSVKYNTNRIFSVDGQEIVYPKYNVVRLGAIIEFKIIILKDNKIGGSYTFNYTPCTIKNVDCHCSIAYKKYNLYPYYNYCNSGNKIAYESVDQNEILEFVKNGVIKMINEIKK